MQPPIRIWFNNRERWNYGLRGLVEWSLWKNARPLNAKQLVLYLRLHHNIEPRTQSICLLLRELAADGRVVKLQRGIYIHAEHATIFS